MLCVDMYFDEYEDAAMFSKYSKGTVYIDTILPFVDVKDHHTVFGPNRRSLYFRLDSLVFTLDILFQTCLLLKGCV